MIKAFAGLFLILFGMCMPGYADIGFDRLTCEYKENPLGIATHRPRFSWVMTSGESGQSQSGYELMVAYSLRDLRKGKGEVWSTGKVHSSQSVHLAYDGKPLQSFTRYYWRVRVYDQDGKASAWSAPQWFETAALSFGDWTAEWISDGSPQFENDEDFYKEDPMPLFRKTFRVGRKIQSARLYVSGMGYYEAYLNGQKVSDHMLDPGWTTYSERVLYVVHDITSLLNSGVNTAGFMVGNGWYNPLPLRFWGARNWRDFLTTGRPCVKAMIRLTYSDGTTEVIGTDQTWQTTPGPVIRNNIYLGEIYDARNEVENWASANPGGNWKNAVITRGPEGVLQAQMQPPVRVTKILQAQRIREVKPGVYLVDMGQNFAGVVRLRVQGPAGTEIVLRYGEDTLKNGQLNVMTSVAGQIKGGNGGPGAPQIAWQEDRYILKGSGTEIWCPRFTFHGFRYVEVSGWPGKPAPGEIVGLRMNSDLQEASAFTSSNAMLNQLDEVIRRTFLSNVFSVQSDCPAREKLAYPGDIFCSAGAFMYQFRMPSFYTKTINDMVDARRPLGGITETAPYVGIKDGSPGDDSGPLGYQAGFPFLVKKMYEYYGDQRVIEENYPHMQRLLEFLRSRATNHLFDKEDLGDHESLDERGIPLMASVFYALHAQLLAEFATILDKSADAEEYIALHEKIRTAIVNKFYRPATGEFEEGTQTAQIVALWAGMPRGTAEEKKTVQAMIKAFRERDWHLSTGIFGTKMMFDVLRERDLNEMAYRIANQRDFPGWGHMLANGATTLWETWRYSDNTYSQNHPMFGSVAEWFYRSLLGINPAAPGFKKIIIKPQPAGDLEYASGHFNSIYGRIGSDWKITGKAFEISVEIPVNTTAEIWIPDDYGNQLTGSEKETRRINGYIVVDVGSGKHHFATHR